jgi:glutaredoxin
VEFVEKNVGKDPAARQELMEIGILSLPVLIIGEQRLTGFNPKKIDEALALLG